MSNSQSSNNKRIAKNTILLYFRMIILMVISLFTSRVILQALGVEDYGISSVIAGFLSMFGIITTSMSNAISRFITVELGRGELERLKQVFSTSISVQLFMGLLIVILIETFGFWFLNTKMQIPTGREVAAQWCLHCATITTFISLMNIPFNSAIVAHERMSAFAYMTIVDATFKLSICYAIYISPYDKLITYSVLGVVVSILTTSIYWIYCLLRFQETSFSFRFDKSLFKEMCGFAGWNLFSQTAWVLNNQGINMLINLFFGVALNAARGIAVQVNGIILNFVNNFMVALNPQITKSYAVGDKETAFQLACRGCRLSFYIMFFLALPVMIESHQILKLWLGTPPEYADTFVVWTILSTFSTLLGNTLVTLQMAHGDIKKYQLWITIFGSIPFPLTWLAFKLGFPAIVSYYVYIAVYWALIFVRYYLVHEKTGISAKMYIVGVVLRTHIVAIVSSITPIIIHFCLPETFTRCILVVVSSMLSTFVIIFFFGLDLAERTFIIDKISLISNKFNKNVSKIKI